MFNVKGFINYLRTIAGGKKIKSVAKSIAADVVKFFNTTPQSSTQRYNVQLYFTMYITLTAGTMMYY